MNTGTLVLLLISQNMSYYLWMVTWMKNVINFQIAKVQPQRVVQHVLPLLAWYKSVAYKKSVFFIVKSLWKASTNKKKHKLQVLTLSMYIFQTIDRVAFHTLFEYFAQGGNMSKFRRRCSCYFLFLKFGQMLFFCFGKFLSYLF